MKTIIRLILLMLMLNIAGISSAQVEFAQRILLDKPLTAGPLKVFPSLNEPNKFYYLPNKLRLATNERGQPEFLFIKYVENISSTSDEKEISVGNGGGYVHLLVGLKVTDEELAEASQELQRISPGGKIVGPVIYKSGTLYLVTKSMLGDDKKVIGIGAAPIMEGDKIAVAFLLNKIDATLLWETMKSPMPDISFNASMVISGFQSPVEFTIDVDYDKVYKHKNFSLAVKTAFVGAEISSMVQDLRQSGAIKVVAIGDNPNTQKLQEILVTKMINDCFQPFGSQGGVNWAELGKPDNTGKSLLDKATDEFNARTKAAIEENKKSTPDSPSKIKNTPDSPTGAKPATGTVAPAAKPVPDASKTTKEEKVVPPVSTAEKKPAKEEKPAVPQVSPAVTKPAAGEPAKDKTMTAGTTPADQKNKKEPPVKKDQISAPSIQILGSYQMKTIRQTGKWHAEAKQYFPTSLVEPIGGNIGAINCNTCLRQVNLDDPLYKQREIVAWIDGSTAADFDKYINYVTVSMRKKHPGGDITTNEVRIDRKNFSKEGNNFKLMYGWMEGDNDRRTWLDYEYKTVWSFFGGGKIDQDWQKSNEPVIPLAAPVDRVVINIIADSARLAGANIRAITTKIYYKITENSEEQVKQVTLNPARRIFSTVEEIMLPKNSYNFDYQVDWLLNNNENLKSARKTSSSPDLYVDVITK